MKFLCVAKDQGHLTLIEKVINDVECNRLSALTADYAVAVCVTNPIDAAIVDDDILFVDEWSVAQSLKLVRPTLTVIGVLRKEREETPVDVDIIVRSSKELRAALQDLIAKKKSAIA